LKDLKNSPRPPSLTVPSLKQTLALPGERDKVSRIDLAHHALSGRATSPYEPASPRDFMRPTAPSSRPTALDFHWYIFFSPFFLFA
jgi:hypothetical protein